MKLTPLDIQQQQFRSKLWGFDPREVDGFLDVVAADFEEVIRENKQLKEDLRRREAELQQHKEREQNLKDTMVTATRITEDLKQNARKEAEMIIGQAETQAEQIIQNAHTRLARVIDDLDELRRQKTQFEESVRSLVQTHLKLLDSMTDREPGGEMLSLVHRRKQREAAAGETADELLNPRG
jgi:cell division initiation protein